MLIVMVSNEFFWLNISKGVFNRTERAVEQREKSDFRTQDQLVYVRMFFSRRVQEKDAAKKAIVNIFSLRKKRLGILRPKKEKMTLILSALAFGYNT